jgi:hypothetical protein
MASKKQSSKSEVGWITTPRTRRVRALPSGPDTTIHFEGDKLAVVVFKPTGGGTGGIKRPKVDICKCTKTVYKCKTDEEGNTVCKEECTEWDCKTIEAAL